MDKVISRSEKWVKFHHHRPYPLWPLPKDYETLTKEGQRQARLSVLFNQTTAENLVIAWDFFRRMYLQPMGAMFYRGGFFESPPFHYEMVEDLGCYGRNLYGAPRGSAKSTVIGTEIPLLIGLTRPNFDISISMATDGLIEKRFEVFMEQLTQNQLIIEDFGIQKPKRGSAIWNHHHLHLTNGTNLLGFSVMGRKRGLRPKLLIMDDPEYDPDSTGEEARRILLEKFQTILFKQMLPMLVKGAAMFWIGTIIDCNSFLSHAIEDDPQNIDPRFGFWNRRVLSIRNPQNKHEILWPEQWSSGDIELLEESLGSDVFMGEMMNTPAAATARIFKLDQYKNEYTYDLPDVVLGSNYPLGLTGVKVLYHDTVKTLGHGSKYEEMKVPINEWLPSLFRVTVMDYASGLTQYHDYSCILVLGFDLKNVCWILDMWMGRVPEPQLYDTLYNISYKWMVKVVGIESISLQMGFVDSFDQRAAAVEAARGWRPIVYPIKYPTNSDKAQRIAAMAWRYERGSVKYPSFLAKQFPMSALYAQTRDFTRDMKLLKFDDAIDTLAMSQYVVKVPGLRIAKEETPKTVLEKLKAGQLRDELGNPLIASPQCSADELQAAFGIYYDKYVRAIEERENPLNPMDRPLIIDE